MVAAALLLWIGMVVVAERLWRAEPEPVPSRPRKLCNITLGLIALTASPLLLWLTGSIAGAVPALLPLPELLPQPWTVALQLLALDAWAYATHRAYHRVPIMWRLHAPHHFDEYLDATSAFRFHIGEVALSAALRLIPATLLGITPQVLLLFEGLLLGAAVFHHSAVALPPAFERMLSRLIVTPSIHWVHHHARRADTDSNYASGLSFWDRLFGSRSPNRRTRAMPIGVEGETELPLAQLLVYPFIAGGRES